MKYCKIIVELVPESTPVIRTVFVHFSRPVKMADSLIVSFTILTLKFVFRNLRQGFCLIKFESICKFVATNVHFLLQIKVFDKYFLASLIT